MSDQRPFHDHGTWKGLCSDAKHTALSTGTTEAAFRLAIEHTRQTEAGVLCACCRFNYTTALGGKEKE